MLRYRPAAMLFLAVAAGVAAGLFFNFWVAFVIMALSWSAVMLIRPARRKRFAVVFSIVAFGIAYLYGTIFSIASAPAQPEKYKYYEFYAAVHEVRTTERGYRATIKIDKDVADFGGCKAYLYLDDKLNAGDCLKVNATLSLTSDTARGNGVPYMAFGSYEITDEYRPKGISYRFVSLRGTISSAITRRFEGEAGVFYNALLTGDRSGLSDKLNGSFSRSGVSHILAISGQHFTILVFSVYRVMLLFTGKIKLSSLISIFLAVFYTLLVGASPAIVRAAIMCCVVFATNIIRINIDGYTALCSSVMIIVLLSPYSAANVSFQLSFMSTLGVLTFVESKMPSYETSLIRVMGSSLITPAILTIASTLFCIPIVLSNFDYLSVVSPVSNFAINAFVTPAMASSVIALPIAMLIPSADWVLEIPTFFYNIIVAISDFMASLSFSTVSSGLPYSKLAIIPSITVVGAGLLWRRKKFTRFAIACTVALCVIICGCYIGHNQSLKSNGLLYICDNEKDCYIFCNNGSEKLLFDIRGSKNCSGVILDRAVTAVDGYVITECTDDSLARLNSVACYVSIDTIYMPKVYENTDIANNHTEYANDTVFYEENIAFEKIEFYNTDGHYTLIAENDDKIISVMGGITYGYVENANVLIVTGDCIDNQPSKEMFPSTYDKLYIQKVKPIYFTSYLKERATEYTEYNSTVEIRYGKDGIWEVKE